MFLTDLLNPGMLLLQNPEMETTLPPSVIRQHLGIVTVMPSISNSRLPWDRIMLCPML